MQRLSDELLDIGVYGKTKVRVERERGSKDTGHERTVTFTVDGLGAGKSGGGGGTAVVRALHDDDVLLLGGSAGELDSSFDGLSARVPEEDGVEGRMRQDREEMLDQLDLSCGEADVDLRDTKRESVRIRTCLRLQSSQKEKGATYLCVCDLAALFRGCFGDFRVAVSKVADTNTGSHIEQLDTFVSGDPRTLAIFEDVLGETANTLGDVGLAERGGVEVCCRHCGTESGKVTVGGACRGEGLGGRSQRAGALSEDALYRCRGESCSHDCRISWLRGTVTGCTWYFRKV